MASKEFLVDVVVDGDVGIGTNDPDSKLEVTSNDASTFLHVRNGDGAGYSALKLSNKSDTNPNGFQIINTAGGGEIKLLNHNNSDLGLWTNSQQRLVVDKGGNIGIGTDDPNRLLTVETGGSGCYLALNSSNNNTTIGSDVNGAFIVYDDSSSEYRMVIDQTTGNVGIGNTDPSEKLEVMDSGSLGANKNVLSITNKLTSSPSVDTTVGMNFNLQQSNNNAITYGAIRVGEHSGTGSIKGSMRFMVQDYSGGFNLAERMRVESNGNVGIGTDSPNEKLEVAGSTRITGGGLDVGYGNNGTNFVQVGSGRTTNGFAYIDLVGDSTYTDYGFRILRNNNGPNADTDIVHRGTGDLDFKTVEAGDIGFWTTSTQKMIVKANGNIGIGTDNPSELIHVKSTISAKILLEADTDNFDESHNAQLILSQDGGAVIGDVGYKTGTNTLQLTNNYAGTDGALSLGTSGLSRLHIESNGNVGIKTTNPSYTLDVTGNIRATGSITENSDESLKENIQTIDNACDKVSKLRGVSYNKIGEEDKKIGVIAQEIEAVVPEVVTEDVDGIKSVSYTNLVGLLIQSNKELIERVSELENIINNKD